MQPKGIPGAAWRSAPYIHKGATNAVVQRPVLCQDDHGYRVSPDLRALMIFTVQNVLVDPPFSRLDLVSCRNLLIYLVLTGDIAQATAGAAGRGNGRRAEPDEALTRMVNEQSVDVLQSKRVFRPAVFREAEVSYGAAH